MHCTTTGAQKDTQPQKPCCKVVAIVHSSSNQQLLCSRFGAMWDGNLRQATKLRTYNSEGSKIRLPRRSTIQKINQETRRMVSPKSVHQRSFGRLCVLTMGGETLHATDSAHRPTQMDPRRVCAHYIKRNAQTRWFLDTAQCGILFQISTLSLPKIAPHCRWDTQQ